MPLIGQHIEHGMDLWMQTLFNMTADRFQRIKGVWSCIPFNATLSIRLTLFFPCCVNPSIKKKKEDKGQKGPEHNGPAGQIGWSLGERRTWWA